MPLGWSAPEIADERKASRLLNLAFLKLMRLETEPYVRLSSSILCCEACDWMTETCDGLCIVEVRDRNEWFTVRLLIPGCKLGVRSAA